MRRVLLFVAAFAVVCAGTSGPATAQSASSDLYVSRGSVKYGWSSADGLPRHTLKLKATVMRPSVLVGLDQETTVDALIGGESVVAVEPGAEGARVRMRGKRRWVGTVRGPAGSTGSRRLKIDLRSGKLVLHVRRADLTAVREGGLSDLPLEMLIGSGEAATQLTFRVRAGANPVRWDLMRSSGTGGGGGDPGGGGGGGGGGGDPGGGVDRELSIRSFASGMNTGVQGRSQRVVRTQAEWNQLWSQHAIPGNTPPSIDFSRDMVLAVFRGPASTPQGPSSYTGIAVSCVKSNGSRVLATWEEVPNIPVNCGPYPTFAPCVGRTAFEMVAVERSTLSVQFVQAQPGTGCR